MRNDILYELDADKAITNFVRAFRHLDISFVNNNILEQTSAQFLNNERNKQGGEGACRMRPAAAALR